MSHLSEKIIEKNKLQDVIQVLEERVEEVVVEGGVDVIVSEWMGFYLFHESMLSSVLIARDHFLKPDGIILPSSATLYAAPASLQSIRRSCDKFWSDVYGFNFSPVVDEMFTTRMKLQPQTFTIAPSDVLSTPRKVAVVDLKYADVGDFDHINSNLAFTMNRHDVLRAISLWFDVDFSLGDDDDEEKEDEEKMETNNGGDEDTLGIITTDLSSNENVKDINTNKQKLNSDLTSNPSTLSGPNNDHHTTTTLEHDLKISHHTTTLSDNPHTTTTTFSTSPSSPPTHWKQTTILLPSPLLISPGGSFECKWVAAEFIIYLILLFI